MNLLDKTIAYISPVWSYKREIAKANINGLRKYEAAEKGRRNDQWGSNANSSDIEVGSSLASLRNQSRKLVRDNPWVKRAIDVLTNNVIGDGITATPSLNNERLKKEWEEWALTTECDFDGVHNFYGLQDMVMRAVFESGEGLLRIRRVKNKKFPIQFQLLESDFIDTDGHNGGIYRNSAGEQLGLKLDQSGRVIGYWLFNTHPGGDNYNLKSFLVPAEEIIHVFRPLRPGQKRGVPEGTSAMLRAKNLDEYEDAQLERQKIAACFTAFVSNTTTVPLGGGLKPQTSFDIERLEPGMLQYLGPNETVTFGNPPPAEGYDPYVKTVLRGIAAGYGISYEALSNDYSQVNFSSGRMGGMEMNRNIKKIQEQVIIPMFCDRVWAEFVKVFSMKVGMIESKVQWTVPKRVMIDPVKEIKAMIDEVRAGFKSWEEAVKENGYDPTTVANEIKRNQDLFDSLGLVPYWNQKYDADRIVRGLSVKENKPKE
jgi:lambda family phage portal protein